MLKARIWEMPEESCEASGSMFSELPRETRRRSGCLRERSRVRVTWSPAALVMLLMITRGRLTETVSGL